MRFFVLLFNELPEDHHLRFLALSDLAAFLLALLEGDVFAGLAKYHLIEKGIRLARAPADGLTAGNPRLLPRDDSLFHLINNALGDLCVNIHMLFSFCLKGSKDLW